MIVRLDFLIGVGKTNMIVQVPHVWNGVEQRSCHHDGEGVWEAPGAVEERSHPVPGAVSQARSMEGHR